MIRSGAIPLAHAFGERYELPIPLWLFAGGGALVVLLSFLLVLRRNLKPGVSAPVEDAVPLEPVRVVPAALGLLVTGAAAVAGLTGTQDTSNNIAPLYFWVLLWIGVPLTVGLLGDWTRAVNPFATLARIGSSPRLRKAVLARSKPLSWTFGWWPAVALFVLLVLGELVFQLDATTPAFVGGMLLLYAGACLFLGLLYGEGFQQRGEVFSALFDAWGRLGFWRFGAPGRRGFAGGLDVPFSTSPSRVVLVLLLLVSINFDGLLSTPQWASYEQRTVGTGSGLELLRIGSLAALVIVVLAVFTVFAAASARAGGFGGPPIASLAYLLPSLVPIAYGYLLAHYLQYLLTNGQLLWPILVDDTYQVDTELLPNSFYWYLSVVVIVAVHVVAVVLANRLLQARAADSAAARAGEWPWLVAMVGYTVVSLVLIAQPLTS